jgi:hypothetical protein
VEAMAGFSEQNADLFEYQNTLEDFTALKNRLEGCRSRIDFLMRTVIGAGSLILSQNSLSQADSAARILFWQLRSFPFHLRRAFSRYPVHMPQAKGISGFIECFLSFLYL